MALVSLVLTYLTIGFGIQRILGSAASRDLEASGGSASPRRLPSAPYSTTRPGSVLGVPHQTTPGRMVGRRHSNVAFGTVGPLPAVPPQQGVDASRRHDIRVWMRFGGFCTAARTA